MGGKRVGNSRGWAALFARGNWSSISRFGKGNHILMTLWSVKRVLYRVCYSVPSSRF